MTLGRHHRYLIPHGSNLRELNYRTTILQEEGLCQSQSTPMHVEIIIACRAQRSTTLSQGSDLCRPIALGEPSWCASSSRHNSFYDGTQWILLVASVRALTEPDNVD